jgi:SAM-dependent methyltransferase
VAERTNEVPGFLTPQMAATFEHPNVAASYDLRPAYPPQVFEILTGLIQDEPRTVLDLGCGTGFVARPLAPLVDRVDAVDPSTAMIEVGRQLPGGDHPHLNWIVGRAESAPLDGPYALATAGDSLHWMDWDVVLPRLAGSLSPAGSLAILTVDDRVVSDDPVLPDAIVDLIRTYSTYREWRPDFDLVATLTDRGLFREEGRTETDAVPFRQPVDAYVESFHARASLSWERMEPAGLAAFDAALRELLVQRSGETVQLDVRAGIVWGKPLAR